MIDNLLERTIMATLIHNPDLIDTVNLDIDWFVDGNYRAIIQAIQELEESKRNELNIWGKAKYISRTFNLTLTDVNTLSNQCITDKTIDSDLVQLHKQALAREIKQKMNQFRELPIDDVAEQLHEATGNYMNLTDQSTDGELDEAINELEYRLSHEVDKGIRTFAQLDDVVGGGLYGSMLFTIGARPSMGKTAYSINLAYEAMTKDPEVEVDYFTFEMGKPEMLNRFISRHTRIMSQALRNPVVLSPIEKKLVKEGNHWIKRHNLKVYDSLSTIEQVSGAIKRNAGKQYDRYGANKYIAFVDYIGLVEVKNAPNQQVQITVVTRELKKLTQKLRIPIVELAQLNRGIESRNEKTPQLSDLRDSGSIEQDSNVVAFLYRPDERTKGKDSDVETLIVQKNREGSLGSINYNFNGREMLFQELKA